MAADGRRLRVLTLIDVAVRQGGAERFAVGLATHLPQDRFEPWICSTRETEPETARALERAGIRHVTLGRQAKWDVHRIAGLVSLLRRERFDILHAHKFGSNVWGTLIGRACRVPVVIAHEHTWSYEGDPLRVWLDGRVIGRLATRFVAVSHADAERMVSIESVPKEKIVVISAAAYWPRPASHGSDLRSELDLPAGTPLIGVAAILRPQKALSVLLRAHALVLKRLPDVHLAIAGGGDCRSRLEELAHELGTDDHVHFLGYRDDVDSVLSAVDVAALSSDYEGTPVTIAECIAANTPLVATSVGGIPEIVDDGETGVLVPPRDPVALAEALTRLLSDPAERKRIAANAAARLNDFTIDAVAVRFAELYETLARDAGVVR